MSDLEKMNRAPASERSFGFLREQRKGVVQKVRRLRSAEKNLKIRQNQYQQTWLCQDGGY